MYGVSSIDATPTQINDAKSAVLNDAMVTLGLVPAVKPVSMGAKTVATAIPDGLKADAVGQTIALVQGDMEFLKGTPTEKSTTQGVGADIVSPTPNFEEKGLPIARQNPRDALFRYRRSALRGEVPGVTGPVAVENTRRLILSDSFKNLFDAVDDKDFYSSVLSYIKEIEIPGKKGIKGGKIKSLLEKNPRINQQELYFSNVLDNIDGNKTYNKEELLAITKNNVPRISVEVKTTKAAAIGDDDFDIVEYFDTQRLFDPYETKIDEKFYKDGLGEYVEILIKNKNSKGNYYPEAMSEWDDPTVISHARGTFFYSLDEPIFVFEEIQSAAVQKNTVATKENASRKYQNKPQKPPKDKNYILFLEDIYAENLNEGIVDILNVASPIIGDDLPFNKNYLLLLKNKNNGKDFDTVSDYTEAMTIIDKTNEEIVKDFAKLKSDYQNDNINLDGVAETLANKYNIDKDKLLKFDNQAPEIDYEILLSNFIKEFIYDEKKINVDQFNDQDIYDLVSGADYAIKDYLASKENLVPLNLNSSVRVALLSAMKEAKKRGVNKLYIPSVDDIRAADRTGLSEKAAERTYKNATNSVLKKLNSETEGKIKYQQVASFKGLEFKLKKPLIEIDITDFDINKNTQFRFAEGGSVKDMDKQMEMMFEEGGIADDGMTQDPVSGNEIPPGSLAEEVRDDIPAQLSDGEYVVPADVVRFYGVKFFEDLRTKAKKGLAQMEEDGRIGGEPIQAEVASISDEELEKIIQEEMAAIQQPVQMQEGGLAELNKPTNLVGINERGVQSVAYINPQTGDILYFIFVDGKITPPGTAIPKGYVKQSAYDPNVPTTPKKPESETPKDDDDDGPDKDLPEAEGLGDFFDDAATWSSGTSWSDGLLADSTKGQRGGKIVGGLAAAINPVAGLTIGVATKLQPQEAISKVRAKALILRAQGKPEEAKVLEDSVDKFAQTQGAFMDNLDETIAPGRMRANELLQKLGLPTLKMGLGEDGLKAAADALSKDDKNVSAITRFINSLSKPTPTTTTKDTTKEDEDDDGPSAAQILNKKMQDERRKKVQQDQTGGRSFTSGTGGTQPDKSTTADSGAGASGYGGYTGTPGGRNKGGLMQRKK
jgi:hypothetical protein